ncbi:ABC transporter permease [Paroceanicella profunda]|uniref:ABC transporter permease n=1 Tax=Paroceanicella profunda TaxID=2579971 RepID=A0A5B8FU49_9RHOB|nr:ABC transporter permease [Paroceanicella profunda]QDL90784.1 ABC transporter permease [Paroceanicella profunda]
MRRRPGGLALAGLGGVAVLALVAVLGPALAPFDPLASAAGPALAPPSARHWAGTDQIGRDVASRLLHAARLDLRLALGAVALSAGVGATLGALSGYAGGWADRVLGRLVEVAMAFPLFVLAMALIAVLGPSERAIVLATAAINLPVFIRLARSETAARRSAGWVEAARLAGNGPVRVVTRFLLPEIAPLLAVQASVTLGWALLNAAGLSFLGLGIAPPTAEWGIMVAEGARYLAAGKWWLTACPGLAIAASVLCFSLAGDALRDLAAPGAGGARRSRG